MTEVAGEQQTGDEGRPVRRVHRTWDFSQRRLSLSTEDHRPLNDRSDHELLVLTAERLRVLNEALHEHKSETSEKLGALERKVDAVAVAQTGQAGVWELAKTVVPWVIAALAAVAVMHQAHLI